MKKVSFRGWGVFKITEICLNTSEIKWTEKTYIIKNKMEKWKHTCKRKIWARRKVCSGKWAISALFKWIQYYNKGQINFSFRAIASFQRISKVNHSKAKINDSTLPQLEGSSSRTFTDLVLRSSRACFLSESLQLLIIKYSSIIH